MALVTNKQISDTIDAALVAAPALGVPDWQAATDALIDLFVSHGECFSSGEIAAHLRTFHPELRFSVTSHVGEHIRERFYADNLPEYTLSDGTTVHVAQVPRTTGGYTRTPIGTQVFVYAEDYQSGMDHEFEVDIPLPGTQVAADPGDAYGLPARPVQAATPVQTAPRNVATTVTGRQASGSLTVNVRTDARVNVPRSVFEALLHETKTALRGGDRVYVNIDDAAGRAIISLDPEPGFTAYNLWATTGRIAFRHPVTPFNPGDNFALEIEADKRRMVIDISRSV